jgi:PIN domain nuclease of toxin-antitoxin system
VALLLDTNVLIPVVEETIEELPSAIRDLVQRGSDETMVSVVSLWEIAIKHRQGKLPLHWRLEDWPTILSTLGVRILNLEVAHVLGVAVPVPDTNDPFDRMLLAVCQAERLQLVTTDAKLKGHPLAWQPPPA